jgi:hypothetical protein
MPAAGEVARSMAGHRRFRGPDHVARQDHGPVSSVPGLPAVPQLPRAAEAMSSTDRKEISSVTRMGRAGGQPASARQPGPGAWDGQQAGGRSAGRRRRPTVPGSTTYPPDSATVRDPGRFGARHLLGGESIVGEQSGWPTLYPASPKRPACPRPARAARFDQTKWLICTWPAVFDLTLPVLTNCCCRAVRLDGGAPRHHSLPPSLLLLLPIGFLAFGRFSCFRFAPPRPDLDAPPMFSIPSCHVATRAG